VKGSVSSGEVVQFINGSQVEGSGKSAAEGATADDLATKQPLEDQRLSTTNSPMFAGLTATGDSSFTGIVTINDEQITGGSPTNGISVEQADVRYASRDAGVWLIGTNKTFYGLDGAAFTNAVASAAAGDGISIGPGGDDPGSITYEWPTSGISVIGAGPDQTTLKANKFSFANTVTNLTLHGMTFTQPTGTGEDLMFWSHHATNYNGSVLKDLNLIGASTSADHCFEISGVDLYLENVASESSNGHAFVLKGVSNAVVVNCESSGGNYDGLLIKASTLKGDVSGVVVRGFKAHARVYLNAANSDTTVENVSISDVWFDSANGGVYLGDHSDGGSGNEIRDVAVDGLSGNVTGTAFYPAYVDAFENVSLRNVSCRGTAVFSSASVSGITNLVIENSSVFGDDGREQRLDYVGDKWFITKGGCSLPSISNGVISNKIRAAEVVSSNLYVVSQSDYPLIASVLSVGDPVWITGGDLQGVYRLTDWGTVTTNDVPATGALVGDFYAEMTVDVTNQVVSVGDFDLRPGKAAYRLFTINPGHNYTFFGSVAGLNTSTVTSSYPTQTAQKFRGRFLVGSSVLLETESDNWDGSYIAAHVHTFLYDDSVYTGMFGGVTPTTAWMSKSQAQCQMTYETHLTYISYQYQTRVTELPE